MNKEKYEDFLSQLDYQKGKWYPVCDVESFLLDNGIGIYPNWMHTRFMFRDNDILIKHGDSKPYGARLASMYSISSDRMMISFPPGRVISPTDYYNDFRLPRAGDILISSESTRKILSASLIRKVTVSNNAVFIELSNQLFFNQNSKFSFYDPSEFTNDDRCIHGNVIEGVYMKFSENSGRTDKKLGIFHESIKIKNIKEVVLKLNTLKTYNIRG